MTSIDISKLPALLLSERHRLPRCSAVYFVFLDFNELLYIGKAVNLRLRWKNHHRLKELNSIKNVLIAWLEVDVFDLGNFEYSFIEEFKPKLNDTPVPKSKLSLDNSNVDLFIPCITGQYADWFIEYARDLDMTPEDLEIVLWG